MAKTLKLAVINTTKFPTPAIRRIYTWICRGLKFPRQRVWEIKVRTRHDGSTSGRAYLQGRRIVLSVPTGDWEELVRVFAHEVGHHYFYWKETSGVIERSRRRGKSYGGSELRAEGVESRFLTEFENNRKTLLAAWTASKAAVKIPEPLPVSPPAKRKVTEVREDHARKQLAKWEKKLKLAKTYLRKWQRKVTYYEKRKQKA